MDYSKLWQEATHYYTTPVAQRATMVQPRFINEKCWRQQFHIEHVSLNSHSDLLLWRILDNVYENRYGMGKHIRHTLSVRSYTHNTQVEKILHKINQKIALEYDINLPQYKNLSRLSMYFIQARTEWTQDIELNKDLYLHPKYENISTRAKVLMGFMQAQTPDDMLKWVDPKHYLENIRYIKNDLHAYVNTDEGKMRLNQFIHFVLSTEACWEVLSSSRVDGAIPILLCSTNHDTPGIERLYDFILEHKMDMYPQLRSQCLNEGRHRKFFGKYNVSIYSPLEYNSIFYVEDEDLQPWIDWMASELNKKGLKKFLYYMNPFVKTKDNIRLKKEPWARAAYYAIQQHYSLKEPSEIEQYCTLTKGMNKK